MVSFFGPSSASQHIVHAHYHQHFVSRALPRGALRQSAHLRAMSSEQREPPDILPVQADDQQGRGNVANLAKQFGTGTFQPPCGAGNRSNPKPFAFPMYNPPKSHLPWRRSTESTANPTVESSVPIPMNQGDNGPPPAEHTVEADPLAGARL